MVPFAVWDEIGAKYEEYLVGKMDATVNEVEGHPKYSSFPTIKLYNKDGSQVLFSLFKIKVWVRFVTDWDLENLLLKPKIDYSLF